MKSVVINIEYCEHCPHVAWYPDDGFLCVKNSKGVTPYNIPDWCPLPDKDVTQ